jgi:hypothetical protein
MDSIRIKNLRSLEDTGEISLCPITILVGKNSSGKSTFLRTFPLLRQSFETRIRGPILWNGQYVDFGDFKDAVYKSDHDKRIEFEFKFVIDNNAFRNFLMPSYYCEFIFGNQVDEIRRGEIAFSMPLQVAIQIAYDKSTGEVYSCKYSLDFFDNKVVIQALSNGSISKFVVNEKDFTNILNNYKLINSTGVLPTLHRVISSTQNVKDLDDEEMGSLLLNKKIKSLINGKTSPSTINKLISGFGLGRCARR